MVEAGSRNTIDVAAEPGSSLPDVSVAGNLPVQFTSFVGREAEIEAVRRLLAAPRRLVTLAGAGGCGKTRLALKVAASVADHYPDGAWWVDLAPLVDASLVPAAVAGVVGVSESPVEPIADTVVAYLSSRRALVVVDNCEHLIDACAALAARIVLGCPGATVLATSREPLGVPGETLWRVPPLGVPSGESLESIGQSEAVRLFVDRASASQPEFSLTNENAGALVEICTRLDGIPLAIELAATRTRVLTAQEIAARLADRFHLLTRGARWALPRQRTLEASIDWSHDLLDDEEQAVFRRLAVFAGSFTLDAAEAVCAGDVVASEEVLDRLSGLVDRSLVNVVDDAGPKSRYRLLETIRAYALRKLVDAGEVDAARERHLGFYVSVAHQAKAGLEAGDLLAWLARIDVEIDNMRAALDQSSDSADPDLGVRLAGLLTLYWFARSDLAIGRARLEATLQRARRDQLDRADALSALCIVCYRAGDMGKAGQYGDEAIAVARSLGEARSLGRALHWRGWVRCWGEGDPRGAGSDFQEAAALLRQTDDHLFQVLNRALSAWCYVDTSEASRARGMLEEGLALSDVAHVPHARCYCLVVSGYADMLEGSFDSAAARLDAAIELADEIGDHYAGVFANGFLAYTHLLCARYQDGRNLAEDGLRAAIDNRSPMLEALMRMALGHLSFAEGDLEAAAVQLERSSELFSRLWQGALASSRAVQAQVALARSLPAEASEYAAEALRLAEATDHAGAKAWALGALGSLTQLEGDPRRAEDLFHNAVEVAHQTRRLSFVADPLDGLAGAVATQGRFEEAARLLGAAQSLRDAIGSSRFPVHEPSHETCKTVVRDALRDDAFEHAWTAGSAMAIDDAIAYARRGRGRRKRPTHGWESLTSTERQVVELVVAGLTNPQIGDRLFISPRTVQTHVAHIFTKLAVTTRAELAAKAAGR